MENVVRGSDPHAGGLSYSRWRELLRSKLRQLGYSPDSFGLHSLRAAWRANSVVLQPMWEFHYIRLRYGRWTRKSEGAKDGYIEDNLVRRLDVTRNLGL